jgi:hypothetical protein
MSSLRAGGGFRGRIRTWEPCQPGGGRGVITTAATSRAAEE